MAHKEKMSTHRNFNSNNIGMAALMYALACAGLAGRYAVCIPTLKHPITTNYPFQMPLINRGTVHFKVVKEP